MIFFKKNYRLRRYQEPKIVRGYLYVGYEDQELSMDIQTLENKDITTTDGTKSIKRIQVFCDFPLMVSESSKQKADHVFYQGKWFECISSILSESTFLKHYTAEFVESLDQEEPPKV